MAAYRITSNGYVRASDGAFIPADPKNADYQAVQAWISAGNVADPQYTTAEQLANSVSAICAEAERRIDVGILVNGKPFKCDDGSMLRMSVLASALAAAAPGTTQTFMTAAGDEFTVNNAQASAISQAQIAWQGAILGKSAQLQMSPPADPTADANWPAQASISV